MSTDSKGFDRLLAELMADPQFKAVTVMRESLAEAMAPLDEARQLSMEKVIAQLARALDEAGLLADPEDEWE